MKKITVIFAVWASVYVVSAIKVNVTIMLPGKTAFENLIMKTENFLREKSSDQKLKPLKNDYVGVPSSYYHEIPKDGGDSYNSGEYGGYYYPGEGDSDILLGNEYYHEYGEYPPVLGEMTSLYTDMYSPCSNFSTFYDVCNCLVPDYTFYEWSYIFVKPALDLAVNKIREELNIEVRLQYRDTAGEIGEASSWVSQIASVDAKLNDQMVAMIGPMESYSMSRVVPFTTHWNILHLSPGAISAGINLLRTSSQNEQAVETLVRTGPVATEVGNCMASILQYYGWRNTCVEVFEDDLKERVHYFLAEGIYEGIFKKDSNYDANQIRLSEFPDMTGTSYHYEEILLSLTTMGRIVVLSAADYVVREFLKRADEYGYSNKEYAYIIVDLEGKLGKTPWIWTDMSGVTHNDSDVKRGLEAALIVTLKSPTTLKYDKFIDEMGERIGEDISNSTYSKLAAEIVTEYQMAMYGRQSKSEYFKKNQYPAYYHDSLMMLAEVLKESMDHDNTTTLDKANISGTTLIQRIAGKTFQGLAGLIIMNEEGDRKIDFSVWDLNDAIDEFEVVGEYSSVKEDYFELTGKRAVWPGGKPPLDIPVCGFLGSKCAKNRLTVVEGVVISIVSLATVVAIISIIGYRRHKLRKELQSQLWRVLWNDITWLGDASAAGNFGNDIRMTSPNGRRMGLAGSDLSLAEVISFIMPSPAIQAKRSHRRTKKFRSRKWSNRVDDVERKTSSGSLISDRTRSSFTTLGMYKGKLVTIKLTNRKKIELTRELQMELKHMRNITHDHLTRFEGACIDPPRICVLTEYCPKGSLRDILLNDEIQLDWMFKFSLMNDLVKGMSFLHSSAINSHGNLKSTNCVVDSRFVLKITDYGLGAFRSVPSYDDYDRYYAKKLWTAPELLRMASPPSKGTQKADVYSFGIILHEIALRKGTFFTEGVQLSAKEIVRSVRNGYFPYFRPTVDYGSLSEGFSNLLQRCWSEDPSERLDFSELKDIIKRFNKGNPGNLLDSLLSRMEQYATNLEGLVEERTAAYLEEKRKADDLLYQMLPVPVVDRLKRGDAVPAEAYESVTIFFSDIVGFTSISATSTPMEVVDMLNDLYTCFDAIIDNFDVYKVETIGDAYMLVSGLPVRNGIRHAAEIARTSLALLRAVNNFKIRHRPNEQLKLRIGIHSGPCCAGVVGLKMPRYCLFGDTVNTASRMESHGLPLLIHVSHSTKLLLDRYGSFHLELRGETEMKGKGSMTTYWLMGENPLTEMPSAEENESQV